MSDVFSESEFERLADRELSHMVEALADLEDDRLDAELESGVLTLAFDDGARFVVNSHRAARQIWMAADSKAWHFDWNGTVWLSTKSREELWDVVESKVGYKLGRVVRLRPV